MSHITWLTVLHFDLKIITFAIVTNYLWMHFSKSFWKLDPIRLILLLFLPEIWFQYDWLEFANYSFGNYLSRYTMSTEKQTIIHFNEFDRSTASCSIGRNLKNVLCHFIVSWCPHGGISNGQVYWLCGCVMSHMSQTNNSRAAKTHNGGAGAINGTKFHAVLCLHFDWPTIKRSKPIRQILRSGCKKPCSWVR